MIEDWGLFDAVEQANGRYRDRQNGSVAVRVAVKRLMGCSHPALVHEGSVLEATGGFEPPNGGFANLCLRPLGYVAQSLIAPTLKREHDR